MGVIIGFVIAVVSLFGGFVAMGGHLAVIWQPWEFVIIGGIAIGTYIIANPMPTVIDTGRAAGEAIRGSVPKRPEYLALLGLLYALMRELRSKPRNEVEGHIDDPQNSEIFKNFPEILKAPELTLFICDYVRLIIIGNARPHEIEALMDEEIGTLRRDKLKPYSTLTTVAEALPALGIVAAVLGIVKAMGAIDQSPQILGGLIGAALVGTFAGIFFSYAVLSPMALKVKATREKQCRVYTIVKQTLLAFMNGALPQIAVEHGRKAISIADRPTIDEVEAATISGGGSRGGDVAQKEAA
ncbi:flagellar motor stator protein MotA [Microvirga terricola]|uniref:Flagellar motor stator protein MotA n=1 Tax=Microvirga terricola TaxID=2719797 RepID=A0ABX0VHL0_9HYPH|nr:flagellar motor stator protein MotA [Microvirga terricola]NIX78420.1 flagellar motor stator protein MotA [Microvirga terricola]